MKKRDLFIAMAFCLCTQSTELFAQNNDVYDIANIRRYENDNKKTPAKKKSEKRVVFMGNSITEGWANAHPDWFKSNNYFGRGISGQTSPQMLLRFQADVVDLEADVVVINAGTNDIAQNTGIYHPSFTLDNIKSMAEIAKGNGIKVILTSVLPHDRFGWNNSIQSVTEKVEELNREIKAYAQKNNIPYADYNLLLRDENGAMRKGLSQDGVHPFPDTYKIMEECIQPIIKQLLKKK